MRIIKTIIIIGCLLLSFSNYSQNGYNDKNKAIGFGVSTNFFLGNKSKKNQLYFDEGILLPKLNLSYQWGKRKVAWVFQTTYQQFHNSRSSSVSNETSVYPDILIRTDSSALKSNNYKLSFGFKSYRFIPPVGFYFNMNFGVNFVNNKANAKYVTYSKNYDLNVESQVSTYESVSHLTIIPEISFAFGKTYLINKRLTIDGGIKSSILFARKEFKSQEIDLTNQLNSKSSNIYSLNSANLLEIYINVQLFH